MYCDRSGLPEPAGNCTEGYYCPSGEIYPAPSDKECQPGHYCPTASKEHNICPPGTYQPYPKRGYCLMCEAGYYCDPAEAQRMNASGVNSSTHGAVTPSICPVGYYCPNQTVTYKTFPCSMGYFGNQTQLSSHDQCHPCTPGYYCDRDAMTAPANKCHVGYYCSEKAISPNPANAAQGGGRCPQGYYCESGYSRPLPCPKGTYGDRTKLGHILQCTDCPGGLYCAQDGLPAPNGTCDAGYFCSGRAILQNPVNQTYGGICPAGYFCPEKTTTPFTCPPGTFNNKTGGTRAQDCQPCTGGQFCQGYGNKVPDGLCDPGYFCTLGAYTSKPVLFSNMTYNNSFMFSCPIYSLNQTGDICPIGSYCPRGSPVPTTCDRGKFCDREGLALPTGNCSAGSYCDFGSMSSSPRPCATGHYCPEGTPTEIECPIGTFSGAQRNSQPSECNNCTAGFYCPHPGMTAATFPCTQGYYCPSGSWRNDTIQCPHGSYCPTGSRAPKPCPAGMF